MVAVVENSKKKYKRAIDQIWLVALFVSELLHFSLELTEIHFRDTMIMRKCRLRKIYWRRIEGDLEDGGI